MSYLVHVLGDSRATGRACPYPLHVHVLGAIRRFRAQGLTDLPCSARLSGVFRPAARALAFRIHAPLELLLCGPARPVRTSLTDRPRILVGIIIDHK